MQGLLELADLPYVGSGVLASSAAMDKDAAKRLFVQAGIPVADYVTLRKAADCRDLPFPYPVFVKPANLGSSVGISKARNFEELKTALDLAFRYDRKVLVERTIVGKEIECSVLGNRDPEASQPCQILPSQEFYDYDDKYLLDKTEFRIPADLSAAQIERVRRLAIRAYQTLECEGMARVDFLTEDATGEIYLNEVNTIPGFTSISMYPKMWDYSGLPYPKLLERLIELALERYGQKKNLKYER